MKDIFTRINDILFGSGKINEYITAISHNELKLTITKIKDGMLINFNEPEPVIRLSIIVNLHDKLDYIKLMNEGNIYIKVRSWISEIPITV